jgi:capsular polysaccharide export protein
MIYASRPIARLPGISVFLEGYPETVIGWGRKRSGASAQQLAAKKQLPFLLLEDGFLRSVERKDPPLSIVLDDLGIYYDASGPSRLEKLIAEPLDHEAVTRSRALVEAWREARVSKYNQAREYTGPLPADGFAAPYVLVCDQTYGDASVNCGQADGSSFARMLSAALEENPNCVVVVKTHPDVLVGGKRGYFDPAQLRNMPRVHVLAQDCHPARLIEEAQAVYAVTSQMGFEGLLWGKKVRTFGMPFYAGWGLTEDDMPAPARRREVSLEQLVHAALVRYPRYVDPETGKRCDPEAVLAHIGLQRTMRGRFSREVYALGFSPWKKPILRRFLGGSNVHFARTPSRVPAGATVAIWGSEAPPELSPESRVLRLEDGFLRSVGLGADLIDPVSWNCDPVGLYYDSRSPSQLEQLLSDANFTPTLIARAEALRQRILAAGITKYNTGATPWKRPENDRRVILVPGQVERDASIRFGAPGIRTNMEMLRVVRAAHPDAYIVYKPHPDVVAGLRAAGCNENNAGSLCDEIVLNCSIATLLTQVDEVHTLTSLTGFEALLRQVPVTCYGQPFYAGWGLTADMAPIARRARGLNLDELVAGTLILYPAYVSRVTGRFTTPERAVDELIAWREKGGGRLSPYRRLLRTFMRAAKSVIPKTEDKERLEFYCAATLNTSKQETTVRQ